MLLGLLLSSSIMSEATFRHRWYLGIHEIVLYLPSYTFERPHNTSVARPSLACSPPSPLLAVQNVTAHPSRASVPTIVLLYNDPLFSDFNVRVKGLMWRLVTCFQRVSRWSFGVSWKGSHCRRSRGTLTTRRLSRATGTPSSRTTTSSSSWYREPRWTCPASTR